MEKSGCLAWIEIAGNAGRKISGFCTWEFLSNEEKEIRLTEYVEKRVDEKQGGY